MAAAAIAIPTSSGAIDFTPSYLAAGGDRAAVQSEGIYMGGILRESAGSAAVCVIVREGSSSGKILDILNAPGTNGVAESWKGPQGIRFSGDLYCEKVGTGTITGSVYIA